jgi:hypothetical protein
MLVSEPPEVMNTHRRAPPASYPSHWSLPMKMVEDAFVVAELNPRLSIPDVVVVPTERPALPDPLTCIADWLDEVA